MRPVLFAALFLLEKGSSLQFNATSLKDEMTGSLPNRGHPFLAQASLRDELEGHGGSIPHKGLPFIINGRDALRGRWPWQVAITVNKQLICGGVLLSNRFVLTAAMCTQLSTSFYEVLIGRHNFRDSSQGYYRSVRRIHNHPFYNSFTKRNDISVLELSSPVSFSTYVQPAYLPNTDASFAGYNCYITGWGSKSGILQTSPGILQEAYVPVISNSECSNRMSHIQGANIYSSSVCVYGRFITPCMGDGGGPLLCRRCSLEPYVVVGVFSWMIRQGSISCLTRNPSVYTRTRPFVYWIQGIVGGDARFPDTDDTGWCRSGGMRNEALSFRHLCLVIVTVATLFSV